MEELSGTVALQISPKCGEPVRHGYALRPQEETEYRIPLALSAGQWLLSVLADSVNVAGDWLFLPLKGQKTGFEAEFCSYYGERPGKVFLSVQNDMLRLESALFTHPGYSMTLYAVQGVPATPGQVLFTAEETDFGQCNAVILGTHGPELAPQLRCPAEITYVFHNEPKVGEIAVMELPTGEETVSVPLSDLSLRQDLPIRLELALSGAVSEKRRYPFTLFHSVAPTDSTHMFVCLE